MTCFCRGGPTCCMRQSLDTKYVPNTGPFKCPDCGTWWSVEHRCPVPNDEAPTGPYVIRPYVGPMGSGSTTSAPWCGICAGWHIPGAGPCTATYS